MHIRSLLYFFGEALKSILRNGWMSLASIAVVAITLLILGSFMVLNRNVNEITRHIKEDVQIVLYVQEEATAAVQMELQQQLIAHPEMQEVRFVSKSEAMERLMDRLGDRAHLVEYYMNEESNPFRNSYELRTRIPEDIPQVAREIERYPGVDYVDYGSGVVEPLFQFTGVVRWVGLLFMGGLAVTAVFLISHTIRLTVYIRRKEIMIMKYVGATEWFIRWPFIFEGLILGFVGALIPIFIIQYSYQTSVLWMQENIYFISMLPPEAVMQELVTLLIPLGMILGVVGSGISVRRFLKV